jgi:hypothetical protein
MLGRTGNFRDIAPHTINVTKRNSGSARREKPKTVYDILTEYSIELKSKTKRRTIYTWKKKNAKKHS